MKPSRPTSAASRTTLAEIEARVVECEACPRLVRWRRDAAADPPRRYAGQEYWARPLPGFGDPDARVAVVGLAPAAHGANRTGRMFTGDRSGQWLYAALHRAGLASAPESLAPGDGLELEGAWITAVVRCAPPANRPATDERDRCLPFLAQELEALTGVRAILALGSFAWDGALRALADLGLPRPRPKPRFAHGARERVGDLSLVGSYHPSQQNTFTGRLTTEMLDDAIGLAKRAAGIGG